MDVAELRRRTDVPVISADHRGSITSINELVVVTKDGREVVAEHFIVGNVTGDRWEFAASIRPLD
ncbi:MAG: hypothetical protein H0W60_01990 [Chloroflexi bacterium]|nr:hypothetical protein [Chloroflexota bacterium]